MYFATISADSGSISGRQLKNTQIRSSLFNALLGPNSCASVNAIRPHMRTSFCYLEKSMVEAAGSEAVS